MYIFNTKSGFDYPVDKYVKGIARINAAHYYFTTKTICLQKYWYWNYKGQKYRKVGVHEFKMEIIQKKSVILVVIFKIPPYLCQTNLSLYF